MLRPHVGQSSPLELAYGVELDLVQIIIVGKEMYSGYANICAMRALATGPFNCVNLRDIIIAC